MFTGKRDDDFSRHLPEAARAALIHKGETPENSMLLRISGAIRGLSAQGEKLDTFETGPNILVTENSNSNERIEVAVEHDSFSGEEDEIELSVHPYKNGEPEAIPVIPRLIFTLKQEKNIWRVSEVTIAVHVPLEDEDYLKSLRKQQDEANESAAQMRISTLARDEAGYAANHADKGYACSLADLYPDTEERPNPFPFLAKEEANGYGFSLSGCAGKPAARYRLTAVPLDPASEMKTFCVDESGTLKAVPAKESANCFSQGKVLTVISEPTSQQNPTD